MSRSFKALSTFTSFLFCFSLLTINGQNPSNKEAVCIGFYNLENLFDTIDDPFIRDWEYTPEGKNHWDTPKYLQKLENLSTVISEMGKEVSEDGLAILGIAEVENKGVLQDLVKQPKINKRAYQIIHYNSPDRRGIDVALLYQRQFFTVENTKTYPLTFKDKPDYLTRDQLVVSGKLFNEEISLIVCHWPSRFGGQSASENSRIEAAKLTRSIIDSLFSINTNAKIILMGDLNDDPINKSLKKYIAAKGTLAKLKNMMLFNPMFALYEHGEGTLAWGGKWNLFDQILVSSAFVNHDSTQLQYQHAKIFKQPYMIESEGRYKGYPLRTTAGGKYLGGYSDHFPVYLTFTRYLQK